MGYPNKRTLMFGLVVAAATVLAVGCGKKDEGQSAEDFAKQFLPDSLSFESKVERAIPHSLQQLQLFATNHPDEAFDVAVNLKKYVSADELFTLFDGMDAQFLTLYYGLGSFNGVYPVDPALDRDSSVALLNLEAKTQIAERIRLGDIDVTNLTDELQRSNMEKEIAAMREVHANIEASGVLFYGAEVKGQPAQFLALMNHPEGLVRVVFPQLPVEGSWVRLSPFQYEALFEKDRQSALQ